MREDKTDSARTARPCMGFRFENALEGVNRFLY